MIEVNAAAFVRVIGFAVGVALYAMLLMMVVPAPWRPRFSTGESSTLSDSVPDRPVDWLLVVTALLGLVWNGHSLLMWAADLGVGRAGSLDLAAAFTALGFLPAVVVHSVLRAGPNLAWQTPARLLMVASYGLSTAAGILHLAAAVTHGAVPSPAAMRLVTGGFIVVGVLLGLQTRSQQGAGRVLWIVSLAVFAVSARHLAVGSHVGHPWFVEAIGHHASLPLVIAILYQDYPFAFADLFLKRALTWLLLTSLALAAYSWIIEPLLAPHSASGGLLPAAVILGLCLGTALLYPYVRSAAGWCVDAVILRRANYQDLAEQFTRTAERCLTAEQVLNAACQVLAPALSAGRVAWAETAAAAKPGQGTASDQPDASSPALGSGPRLARPGWLVSTSWQRTHAVAAIPTTEAPWYTLAVDDLTRGRRLLSDDIHLLESVALVVGRRVDTLRLTGERFEQAFRQHELHELAVEAEHFLFNALNTIGYLIQARPDRAFTTLIRLTELLRRVLRTEGEFTTLGNELDMATAYLDVERARFDDRLQVTCDVPEPLRPIRVPTLLLQPLVENAVTHGITPSRAGGEVTISARVTAREDEQAAVWLRLAVRDTGPRPDDEQDAEPGHRGIGLRNVESRLKHCYGERSSLVLRRVQEGGMLAEIWIPLTRAEQDRLAVTTPFK
jgi:two-component system LytT family sensor kinase